MKPKIPESNGDLFFSFIQPEYWGLLGWSHFEHNMQSYFSLVSPTGICPVGLTLWKACHKSQWLVGSCWVQLSLEAEKYCLLSTSNSMYMHFFIDSTLSQVTIPLRVEPRQSGH